ncbi:MAG TPA: AMP-binding protein, partial [Ktedonobacteraceae bacterium]|nr:AMP-binding protein [Ktedonobacteraceae bacterium]
MQPADQYNMPVHDQMFASYVSEWVERIIHAPAFLELPFDRPRVYGQPSRRAIHAFTLTSLFQQFQTLHLQGDITLPILLLAAYKVLLCLYTDQNTISVAMPVLNIAQERNARESVAATVLFPHVDLSGNPSGSTILQRVRDAVQEAYAYRSLPFEQFLQEIKKYSLPEQSILFQMMFSFYASSEQPAHPAILALQSLIAESELIQLDLSLSFFEDTQQELHGMLEYNQDVFDAETIARLVEHFMHILETLIAHPDTCLSEFSFLTEEEKQLLLVEWNGFQARPLGELNLHQLFEAQAAQTPDALAIICDNVFLTYAELNRRANQLAHYLRSTGIRPDIPVGMYITRSVEMVIGILGVIKAGGVYLPLDSSFPPDRLAFMLQNAKAEVLITLEQLSKNLLDHEARVVCLDSDWPSIACMDSSDPFCVTTLDHAVSLFYTSGSTGLPKGVVWPQRMILNACAWMWETYPFEIDEIACHRTTISFGPSMSELFAPLLKCIPICILSDALIEDISLMVRLLADNQVTRIFVVPSLLRAFLDIMSLSKESLPRLRLWRTAGEALSKELVERFYEFLPHATLINSYGGTEVHVATACE